MTRFERPDRSMIAAARVVLSWGALFIVFIDPTEPDRFVTETYGTMVLYSLYSLYLLVAVWKDRPLPGSIERNAWWIDTTFYLVLIGLSSGTNSVFFFAVITAAFARGFRTGILVTVVSAVGFTIVGLLFLANSLEVDLGRFFLRPLSLLVIGYMMSVWGEHQNRSRRRLELLRDIGLVSNPRFGIDRMIEENLELIRDFYNADQCLFATFRPDSDSLEVRHRSSPHRSESPSSISPDSPFAEQLLAPPKNLAAIWNDGSMLPAYLGAPTFYAYDCEEDKATKTHPEPFRSLVDAIGGRSLLTCPIYYRGESIGRFVVSTERTGVFDRGDIPFLLQAIDQFIPVVENIRLVDRMASDAADLERKRIARNIHDSIIQPYIGLQLGIESLSQYIGESGGQDSLSRQMAQRIERLEEIARRGIDDLRNYVHGLSSESGSGSALLDSVDRFAQTFTAGTGIRVELEFEPDLRVQDRLAAEVFQMIAEALSNVRKHTSSKLAVVRLSRVGRQLELEITNDAGGSHITDFQPRSIAQRAASLGGNVRVVADTDVTRLRVSIPM